MKRILSAGFIVLLLSDAALCEEVGQRPSTEVPVGVAKIDVTPSHPVLLAGYGGRIGEHEGVDDPIFARAMAIGQDEPVMVIAVDNCGVPASLVQRLSQELDRRFKIRPERLNVCSTHTHNAPSLPSYAPILWQGRTTPEQDQRAQDYEAWLLDRMIEVAGSALADREPATLSWGQGRATFGGNRRVMNQGAWAGFGFEESAPVDHSVPIMVARDRRGQPRAIWVNYACHCTTVGSRNTIGGDWAGAANREIESRCPGAISITTIGCGADIGPQPSGTLQLAQQHGRSLAEVVLKKIESDMTPLTQVPTVVTTKIQLPLESPPSRDVFEKRASVDDHTGQHARSMLERLDTTLGLQTTVDYPIRVWKFNEDLAIVFLAGEVCVDYAIKIKSQLDWQRVWINGWSNDVPSYIPSKRVLAEGGYEAEFSQIYYALPSRYSPDIEPLIVNKVKELCGTSYYAEPGGRSSDWFQFPESRSWFEMHISDWYRDLDSSTRSGFESLLTLESHSQPGFGEMVTFDHPTDVWFNFSGRKASRPYLRQTERDSHLAWTTAFDGAMAQAATDEPQVFLFLGGMGWESEPETDGFELRVNGRPALTFDVAREPATWTSDDGQVTLQFFPTWRSDLDAAGLFYLSISQDRLRPRSSQVIGVRSIGEGSKRWFSVDTISGSKKVEQLIVEQFRAEKSDAP